MSTESKRGGRTPKPGPEDDAPELTDEELDGTSGGDKITPILTYFPKVEIDLQFDPLKQDTFNPRTIDPGFKRR
jgi:hypothetical protein